MLVYAECLAWTYTCVELVLSFACRKLGDNVGGATRGVDLRSKAG